MERGRTEGETRKGPWTAEEDEILMNFVNVNGPRDWSSIRSKGLLPRTGKSCRLRWVNKLRPNLKKYVSFYFTFYFLSIHNHFYFFFFFCFWLKKNKEGANSQQKKREWYWNCRPHLGTDGQQ